MQQQKIESKYQTQKKNIYIFICSSSLRTVVVVVVDIFLAIWVPIYVRHGEHDCVCLSMLSMHASVYALRLVARALSLSRSPFLYFLMRFCVTPHPFWIVYKATRFACAVCFSAAAAAPLKNQ